MSKKILVIGSSNTDLIVTVDHFPCVGETIEGISFKHSMGGKGANQALAAHRTGGNVNFVTCLGNDANGNNLLQYYKNECLDISYSRIEDNVSTGVAMIWVDKKGENSIVIIPGANEYLSPDYIFENQEMFETAEIIVLQMEIPYETVKTICELGYLKDKIIILNVAPAYNLDKDILKSVKYLVVNEIEAEVLTGLKIEDIGEVNIINKLLNIGVESAILTLGSRGCLFKNAETTLKIPAFKVKSVDTTAAGDTFCGALATGISKNRDIKEVLEFASAAAALCVTRFGAQTSIPSENEVFEFLSNSVKY